MATLERAIEIAVSAHKGQLDKAGQPYILHVLQVMMKGKTLEERIVGVLHDIVEDTTWTIEQLATEGFSQEILQALDALSMRPGEDYQTFLNRTKQNPLSIRVKINDLESNMDITRMYQLSYNDVERFNKYLNAYRELINLIK
jgi:(p)ppGpp synthase/HD superfamily hydrolase